MKTRSTQNTSSSVSLIRWRRIGRQASEHIFLPTQAHFSVYHNDAAERLCAPKPEKPTMPYVTMLYTCEARSQHVQMALIPEDSAGTATAHQRPPQESTASS